MFGKLKKKKIARCLKINNCMVQIFHLAAYSLDTQYFGNSFLIFLKMVFFLLCFLSVSFSFPNEKKKVLFCFVLFFKSFHRKKNSDAAENSLRIFTSPFPGDKFTHFIAETDELVC